ncbi:hypothetical protein AB0E82_34260 [Streptomyces anulatus]|uniref:hypothetical protein n=1 Tax=Streptomyces anulatus TaxID=1892 RepID=UPI0033F47726
MTYGPFLSRRTLLTAAGAVGLAGALPAPPALASDIAPSLAALPPVAPTGVPSPPTNSSTPPIW